MEKSKALKELSEIGEQMEHYKLKYEKELDSWWSSLSEKEREDAFYKVCQLVYKGDIEDRGSYRHVLYDVFKFDAGMYGAGMDCGYMTLHNLLVEGLEAAALRSVNRIEVIDETGRAYTKYLTPDQRVELSLQDDNNTAKIFIKG